MTIDIKVKTVTPQELGWTRRKVWQKPDGTFYEFPPNAPELLEIFPSLQDVMAAQA
jgi:hypothetical protein